MTGKALSAQSKRSKIAEYVDRIGAFRCLLILYALFVVIQTLLNGYCKHIETYDDEWVYYGIAESLVKGMGFPAIYGEKYTLFNRYIYPLLIAPGMMAANRLLQFRLITMLNAIMIGNGIFPVYLLAKRVLGKSRYALLAATIYLLQPDMEFTATFMTENIWLPVSLWTIFLFYQFISEAHASLKKRIITAILFFVSAAVLVSIKSSGIAIVIALGIYYISFKAYDFIKNRKKREKTVIWLASGMLLCLAFLTLFAVVNYYGGIVDLISAKSELISANFELDPKRFIWCYVFTLATEIMAVGVFPVILPLLSFRCLSTPVKRLLAMTLVLTFVSNVGVAQFSLSTTEAFHMPDFRLHQRYVIYLWVLFLISFLYVIDKNMQISLLKAGISAVVTFLFCLVFKGAVIASSVDMSLLLWAVNWMNHRWVWILAMTLFVCCGILLLRLPRSTYFSCFYVGIMSLVFVYDHYAMHKLIENPYRFEYSDIEEVERFVRDNSKDTFLVVTLPNTIYMNDVHLNAKIADTFLVYPNTIFASGNKVTGIQSDHGIDLMDVEAEDLGISIIGPRSLKKVDYIVLTNEMTIDPAMCEQVVENDYFSIYQLKDQTKIPYMEKKNNWFLPGKTSILPEAGFFSNFYKEDQMEYVSGEQSDYVLYGPYVSLSPGRYTITLNYSYKGEARGIIGTADICGSELESAKYQKVIHADQNKVTLSFDLVEQCNDFEVRLLSKVGGIQVDSVDIDMLGLTVTETAGYKLLQFWNSNHMILREEYYSPDGEKINNNNGYHAVDHFYHYGDKIKSSYYDKDGNLVVTTSGYAIIRCDYNDRRQLIREAYYGIDDKPMSLRGYQAIEYERDENGYPIELRYYDDQGDRVALSTKQAMIRRENNEAGQIVRESYYDVDYDPVMRTDGYNSVEYSYDKTGNQIECRYYDLDGELISTTSGYSIIRRKYNEARQMIREEYYDDKNELTTRSEGYSAVEYRYDEDGNITEYRYLDSEGDLTQISGGYAILRKKYNKYRRVVREEYYDSKSELTTRTEGYSAVDYHYDEVGNTIEYRYYGLDGEPTLTNRGYAILRRKYNKLRQIIREEYFDKEDELTTRPEGYSILEYSYDKYGNTVEYRYYDVERELTQISRGYAIIRKTYNEAKQAIREEYYDKKGNLTTCSEGYHAIVYDYDQFNNIVEYRYYDLSRKLTQVSSGYAILRREYNEKRQVIRESYFDEDDQPVMCTRGFSAVEYARDAFGHAVEEQYYGLNRELTDNSEGYAHIIRTYDQDGEMLEEKVYSADGIEVEIPRNEER